MTVLKFCIAIALSLCIAGVAYGQTSADPSVCDRTDEVETAILNVLSLSASDCGGVTTSDLGGITGTFDLSEMDISALRAGDFNGLSGVTELYVHTNNLMTLPPGILDEMAALEYVDVEDNLLVTVEENLFANNRQLSRIELGLNTLGTLPVKLFSGLTELRRLGLAYAGFERLPHGIFNGLNLTTFNTEGILIAMDGALPSPIILLGEGASTEIDLRPAFVQGNGTRIEPADNYEITVAASSVATVSRSDPDHRASITSTSDFGMTEVAIVGGNIFNERFRDRAQTLVVQVLALVCDRTQQVEDAILNLLPSISDCNAVTGSDLAGITGTFDLSNASISTLRSTDFGGLSGVTELNLSRNNNLETLPLGIFDGMTELRALVFRHQGTQTIRRLPYGIFDNVNITNAAGVGLIAIDGWLPSTIAISLADNPSVTRNLEPAFRIGFADGLRAAEDYHFTNGGDAIDIDGVVSGSIDDDSDALTITGLAVGTRQVEVRAGGGSTGDPVLSHTITINVFDSLPICERTRQVQDEIVSRVRIAEGDDSIACSEITDEQLSSITQIDLSDAGLASLNPSDFYGLSGVTRLDIDRNDLTELPPNIFSEMASLTILRANYNDIGSLPENLFANNNGIQTLYINGNELTELPEGIFNALTSLEELDIAENDISSLPENLFANNNGIQRLDIDTNDLTELPEGIFDALTSLEELHIRENDISSLPGNLFVHNTNLRLVNLGVNDLSTLPINLFNGLRLLERLGLEDNELIDFSLPVGIFNNLDSLDELTLYGNNFGRLDDGVFDGLNLTYFETDGPIAMVGALPSIIILADEDSITVLDLEPAFVVGNFRGGIQPASSYTVTVTDESIAEAVVSSSTADHTTTITALVAEGNTQVMISVPNSATLVLTVYVGSPPESDPPTTSVCDRTDEVETAILSALTLSAGDCAEITVAQLAEITDIDLSNQSLSALQSTDFNDLSGASSLHLNNNSLTALPLGIFDEMSRLVELNLSNNNIDRLPFGIFDRLRLLTVFNISGTVAIDGALPSATITLNNANQSTMLNLRSAFIRGTGNAIRSADPDDYSISVVDESVAEASRDDHAMTITAINTGMTEVVISIGDVDREHRITVDSEWSPVPIIVNPTRVSVAEGRTADVMVSVEGEIEATLDVAYGTELTGPNQVTAPADGEVTLSITADNPAGYQGDRERTVTLSAPGYISADVTVRLLENDLDGLTIALDSNRLVIEESGGISGIKIEKGDRPVLDVRITGEMANREVNTTATSNNTDVAAVDAASKTMLSLRAVDLGLADVTLTATGEGYSTAMITLNVEVIEALPDIIVKDPESDTAIDEIALAAGEATTLSVSLSEIGARSTEVTISTMPPADYIMLSETTLSFSSTDPQELTVSVSPDASPGDETDLVFEAEGYTTYRIPLEVRVNKLIFRIKVFLEGAQ